MAELILTPEEEAAASYLDWSDESLGKIVKKILINDEDGKNAEWVTMAAHLLIDLSIKKGSNNTKMEIIGVIKNGKNMGDWEIRIKRRK